MIQTVIIMRFIYWLADTHISGPVCTKLFGIRIKIRLKLNILTLWTFFKTYNDYLTIDCCCLIKYVLQTRLLGILSIFYERKGKFYSCDRYQNLSPLNNRINLVHLIVSNMFFNLLHFRSQTTFTMSMYTQIKFWIMGNSPEIFILKLEPDLDLKPEKLCEHGARLPAIK